ncbi:protein of unknown function [Methylotuvimicrobium alcaliphilum 20Z]|uniref:Uncharacterized protein n=1 Tax=Methylotuvimicrobium alcaliphilum (strain DSM 19304 / NCIMB 14124 / VKM B-2133 / 20Z) TaxID=1091494 RepID=G4T433_META2|nr:hypothetical protein [Methylotuvimicrobium alcaliphilum]CCE23768.1 protein of unknown function [Methylotuvimicrobium alcaliphilum 20Z]
METSALLPFIVVLGLAVEMYLASFTNEKKYQPLDLRDLKPKFSFKVAMVLTHAKGSFISYMHPLTHIKNLK